MSFGLGFTCNPCSLRFWGLYLPVRGKCYSAVSTWGGAWVYSDDGSLPERGESLSERVATGN